MEIQIGDETLRIDSAVFDFNGTWTVDGILVRGVAERLRARRRLQAGLHH